ncbi:hypothetical protein CCDG5_0171 [[Clostridium] cellulosi]|uniref:Cys-rich peptide, Clo7bot family n=1 Tax=[Clostridium] cellulosi TaxID=29343 RepID=A0A078KQC1_9FIRM|nr:hypothetical protein CCDG5_0171 [[Clostridium] cellulosi]
MRYIVKPINAIFEGYCLGGCGTQCQGKCTTLCAYKVR